MRVRVNIDAEVLADAKRRAARERRSLGSVVGEALRRLLSETDEASIAATKLPDFAYRGTLRDGVDLYDKAALGELLGDSHR
ncbi:hypothetical protein [Agrococcus lahaulensis]|uniref:hypothetical protein n=1 Tax=Agrococcus lahaulensis TaxID=341722 RepID=UPI00047DD24F|nr:hypothetical protein [Agrococcus lahaulensis]